MLELELSLLNLLIFTKLSVLIASVAIFPVDVDKSTPTVGVKDDDDKVDGDDITVVGNAVAVNAIAAEDDPVVDVVTVVVDSLNDEATGVVVDENEKLSANDSLML